MRFPEFQLFNNKILNNLSKLAIVLVLLFIVLSILPGWIYGSKEVLLTFDDGPSQLYTPTVLEILAQNHIKAMFFVVGQEAAKNPELLKEISRQGHILAIHTYTHRDITYMSPKDLEKEILLTAKLIQQTTGQRPVYFRPPRGHYSRKNIEVINNLGFIPVIWDAGLEKKRYNNDAIKMVKRLIFKIKFRHNPVLLIHDGDPAHHIDRSASLKALPDLIQKLKAGGYSFADPDNKNFLKHVELTRWNINEL
ncbi:polysaccharide deacetylase family protein [Desulfotruncus alcoholivorax]|uniref:polysaccharide deacetylase family protein n=1 Tax=Desulfotruncus alcoholivorax TaxID=265477 RepID=UPI000400E707|nr:polysaccharide deacetylase family protein [Desulfotruncus alcoholivorax]